MQVAVAGWDFAQKITPRQWSIFLLVVATFVTAIGVWSIFRLRAWFREDDGRADDTMKLLTQFRDLHLEGGISEEEYRLIRSQLAVGRNSQSVAGKGPPTSAQSAERPRQRDGKSGPDDVMNDESRSSEKPPT